MEGYIAGFAWKNRFVMSNAFRVRFSLAPSEYCVTVIDALRVPLLHELTYRTTWLYKSRDAAYNSRLIQCPNLNHASTWAI